MECSNLPKNTRTKEKPHQDTGQKWFLGMCIFCVNEGSLLQLQYVLQVQQNS